MLDDPGLNALLNELHALSKAQERETAAYYSQRTGPWRGMEPRDHQHFADKLVALDPDKARFCYGLCRATGARRIVELGRRTESRRSISPPLSATMAAGWSRPRNGKPARQSLRGRTSPRLDW
jgi:hypothetical protein